MPSEKQRLKRQGKKKKMAIDRLEMKKTIKDRVEQAKRAREERRAELARYKEAELKIISYIFNAINGRMPNEGESMDQAELKEMCKKFLKDKPAVGYFDDVAKFAKKKIKEIEESEKKNKKIKKLIDKKYEKNK